jgi:hypothetical protein
MEIGRPGLHDEVEERLDVWYLDHESSATVTDSGGPWCLGLEAGCCPVKVLDLWSIEIKCTSLVKPERMRKCPYRPIYFPQVCLNPLNVIRERQSRFRISIKLRAVLWVRLVWRHSCFCIRYSLVGLLEKLVADRLWFVDDISLVLWDFEAVSRS